MKIEMRFNKETEKRAIAWWKTQNKGVGRARLLSHYRVWRGKAHKFIKGKNLIGLPCYECGATYIGETYQPLSAAFYDEGTMILCPSCFKKLDVFKVI